MKTLLFLSFCAFLNAFNLNSNPRLAVSDRGDAIVFWEAFDGKNNRIQKASQPNGGSWSAPDSVSSAGSNSSNSNVAMNTAEQILCVWQTQSNTGMVLESDIITSFGGSDNVQPVITEAGVIPIFYPTVGIDGSGNGVAVWQEMQGSNYIINSSTYLSGQWQETVSVDPMNSSMIIPFPNVVVNANGQAVAVWYKKGSKESNSSVRAAFLTIGEPSWSTPATISIDLESARAPQVAMDSAGNTIAVWHEAQGSVSMVMASTCAFNGTWTDPIPLSSDSISAINAHIAFNDSGIAVAVWEKIEMSGNVIQASIFDGMSWTVTPVDLSSASAKAATLAQVALDNNGDTALVSWSAQDMSGDTVIQGALWTAEEGWNSAATISDPSLRGYRHQICFDGAGNAITVWEAFSSPSNSISEIQGNFRPAGAGSSWGMTVQTISQPISYGVNSLSNASID